MLLAEELALVAIDPDSGRHALGVRSNLNACLAGLLIAELALPDPPATPLLDAVSDIVDESGSKPKAALSAMSRGLERRLGKGTWDAVVDGLVDRQVLAPPTGVLRPHTDVVDVGARDEVVARLRTAAAGDDPLDVRTALLLSMTGPAQLLELVAPERSGRRHARRRIDHALDGTFSEPIAEAVRKVLADAAAAVIATTVAATAVAGSS
ncbi:MAG: GPP34 family phosphoprotein [Ilumatobacteraceae bacterium]